jgi:hypothetical protein
MRLIGDESRVSNWLKVVEGYVHRHHDLALFSFCPTPEAGLRNRAVRTAPDGPWAVRAARSAAPYPARRMDLRARRHYARHYVFLEGASYIEDAEPLADAVLTWLRKYARLTITKEGAHQPLPPVDVIETRHRQVAPILGLGDDLRSRPTSFEDQAFLFAGLGCARSHCMRLSWTSLMFFTWTHLYRTEDCRV